MLEDASACPRFFRGIKRENKESIPGAPCLHRESFREVMIESEGFTVVLDSEDFGAKSFLRVPQNSNMY